MFKKSSFQKYFFTSYFWKCISNLQPTVGAHQMYNSEFGAQENSAICLFDLKRLFDNVLR